MTHVYDWGLQGPECLAIKCPRCGCEARYVAGVRTDERGCRYRDENGRCTCLACGHAGPHKLEWPDDAYFTARIGNTNLWAWNLDHAIAIRNFVESHDRDVCAEPGFKLSLIHLPGELLQASARIRVVKRIDRMLEKGGLLEDEDTE